MEFNRFTTIYEVPCFTSHPNISHSAFYIKRSIYAKNSNH